MALRLYQILHKKMIMRPKQKMWRDSSVKTVEYGKICCCKSDEISYYNLCNDNTTMNCLQVDNILYIVYNYRPIRRAQK